MVPGSHALALNRVLGLGLNQPFAIADLERIKTRYRDASVQRFFVQILPSVLTAEVTEMLVAAGFEHYNNWVKLTRAMAPLEIPDSELRVERIAPGHAEAFGRIITSCFEWGEDLIPWVGGLVGRKNWHCYLAFDGDEPVATGAFYRHGRTAWIDCAATLTEYRGRGAQSQLLKRRIDDATELGCNRLVVETAQETAELSAASYRNMIRYGFAEAYVRPNYIYEF
jgi:GNAT superfamily N-acetyltransferase